MKIKYERAQGMSSIYRKLRKECLSFNVRRHVATLILAVAMMAPAGVYADWTGCILSEKRAGQAYADGTGWAGPDGELSLVQFEIIGNGVVRVEAINQFIPVTVHGTARLTVDGAQVTLEDCDHALLSCQFVIPSFIAPIGTTINVELKGAFNGAFQKTDTTVVAGSQRGTLTFELTTD